MIDLQQFLKQTGVEYTYALVSYKRRTVPLYFFRYDGHYFESVPQLYEIRRFGPSDDMEALCLEMAAEEHDPLLTTPAEYYKAYIAPMLEDRVLYEIVSWQCEPFLPRMVDDIRLLKERDMLLWMLRSRTTRE